MKTDKAASMKQYVIIRQYKEDGSETAKNTFLTPQQLTGNMEWTQVTFNFTTEPDATKANFWFVFDCEDALQMKAVAVMIQKASQYHSTIYIVRSGRRANAKSLLGVMSLGIENGAEIEIEANGDDEKEACEALISHLKNPKIAV